MNDQATTLRAMATGDLSFSTTNVREFPTKENALRCLAITGGKGGVGKSNLSVNLALELGKLNKKVILLDADFGLANADLLCGVAPKFHLGHVISGVKTLEEIAIEISKTVQFEHEYIELPVNG